MKIVVEEIGPEKEGYNRGEIGREERRTISNKIIEINEEIKAN